MGVPHYGWVEMNTAAKLTPALEEEVRRIARDELQRELARRASEHGSTAEGETDGE